MTRQHPNGPGTFKTESRPYGGDGQLVRMVGCRCRKCGKTSWVRTHSPGAGAAIFQGRGWLLGRAGAGTDVGPCCRTAAKPGMPKRQRIAAYNRIEDQLAEQPPVNTVLADKLTEALEQAEPTETTMGASMTSDDAKVRQPTREQRRSILDALDTRYDQEAQRYRDDYSDLRVAEILQYPRVWVTGLRVELYGDHDRNEATERKKSKMDEAIAIAEAAVEKLTSMALEAEKVWTDLKTARTRLA